MTALWPVVNELIRFEIELYNVLDARLRAEHGLSMGRFETMQVLQGSGPCRVQDVADELVISVGGASKVVDRVEAAGLCVRRANPDDRRSSLIELTAAGRRMLTDAAGTVEAELLARIGGALPAAGVREFGQSLTALRNRSASAKEH